MGSVGSPVSSTAPNPNDIITSYNNNSKDCLQVVFCSKRCPQWCVPPLVDNDDDSSGTSFSPLIIALITILATAFLLIIYYFFISKYCKKRRDGERDHQTSALSADEPLEENLDRLIVLRSGLDNGSIESITVFKYKRGDGLVESTECAVCLSDFREGESLRLLPNCSHAFHIHCIDAWLKSNPNCPLCRANGDPFLPPPSRQVYMSNH